MKNTWAVGDEIHGFAEGFFGRDSYNCRRVIYIHHSETFGTTLITESTSGQIESIAIEGAAMIDNPSFCFEEVTGGSSCALRSR